MEITLRRETPADYASIRDFVKTAFETAKVADGTEQDVMDTIRSGDKYIPELALIAEHDGEMVGYIMLSKTTVVHGNNMFNGLLVAPVCTRLDIRNEGVGSQMIKKALDMARDSGYTAAFLAGDRNYYSRFGFVPASTFGISCNLDVPEDMLDNIMAREITTNALADVSGVVDFIF